MVETKGKIWKYVVTMKKTNEKGEMIKYYSDQLLGDYQNLSGMITIPLMRRDDRTVYKNITVAVSEVDTVEESVTE